MIGKTYRSSTILILGFLESSETIAAQPGAISFRPKGAVGAKDLLPLDICEGSPCFARKRLLKARQQGLI
jgi:hypothetical protein